VRNHQAGEGNDGHEIAATIEGTAPADQDCDSAKK
jgi:hypothetical protein